MDYHSLTGEKVISELGSSINGLDENDAKKRLEKYGRNVLESRHKISPARIFAEQFRSPLVIVLIAASVISFITGFLPGQESGVIDSLLILMIVIANSIFGFVQDYKAERSMEALRKMSAPSAMVLRNRKKLRIGAEDLVPGDIIFLEEGSIIPADCRIIDSSDLRADESILTGESLPVKKGSQSVGKDAPLAERSGMVWMNTMVIRGSAKAIVTATALDTQVGKIASTLQESEKPVTPFQKEVSDLGKKIGYGVLLAIGIMAFVQLISGSEEIITIFLISISLAVAAIPEGLPAVVTLALAMGTSKMSKKNALVRKLNVVESLGSVDIICTDKTGTLTENRMTVRKIYFNRKVVDVSGSGYSIKGKFRAYGKTLDPESLRELLEAGMLCNNASMEIGTGRIISGDPTESALLISARKAGIVSPASGMVKCHQISFSSDRKRMACLFRDMQRYYSFMKGAPEVVLGRCVEIYENGRVTKLTEKRRKELLEENEKLARNSLRVLAFAKREFGSMPSEQEMEIGMVFLGLQAMEDPPREGVKKSILECKKAGIRTVMITGDNISTAKAIAKQLGIGNGAYEGKDLDRMEDDELCASVEEASVFARVSPDHKVRILKCLQKNGHRVAITGDGVNDAPALKSSDVGISMGMRGSDVAKQASDMVLLDDNFSTIVSAIREGRTIFDNIRKFVIYLLTCNLAEVMVVFIASLFGYLAVTPVQLLWINLMTDGAPAIALAADPSNRSIMKKKPRKNSGGILDRRSMRFILLNGSIMTAMLILLFINGLSSGIREAQSMVFVGFVLYEFVRIAAIRQDEQLSWNSNRYLLLAIAGSMVLQLTVMYSALNSIFGVSALGMAAWSMIVAAIGAGWILSTLASRMLLGSPGKDV